MSSGLQAVRDAIDAGKTRSSSGGGSGQFGGRLDYFTWKDKDRKIVRFLTDDLLIRNFADRILTNKGTTQDFLIYPENNLVEKYGGQSRSFEGTVGPIKTVERIVGVAVLREERAVPGEKNPNGSQKTEIVDFTYNKEIGGQKYPAKFFGIVKQAPNNFWNGLVYGPGEVYGTITDRDYMVVRVGADKDTSYTFIPLEPVDALRDQQALHEHYGYGRPWNNDDPNRFLYCPQTLAEWEAYYGGEERIQHWLGGMGTGQTQQQGWNPPAADEPTAQPAPQASGTLADLRSRLMPHVSGNLNSDEPPPF